MRTLTYVQPGQTLSCIGCHEHRDLAPRDQHARPLRSWPREPSRLAPGPEGSWPLQFDELVQPVLDRHCTSCHRTDGADVAAARFDLTAAKSYDVLMAYADKDLATLAFEKPRSVPGDCVARQSKLWALLRAGHEDVRLAADDWEAPGHLDGHLRAAAGLVQRGAGRGAEGVPGRTGEPLERVTEHA